MIKRPTNSFFPIYSSDGPYIGIKLAMQDELIEHINWFCSQENFYHVEAYQQMIVDYTIALVKISRLDKEWKDDNLDSRLS